MRNIKIYNISSIIIFSILLVFLASGSADAQDYSGDWNGQWFCNTHRSGGNLYLNLTQKGTIVNGTLSMSDYACVVNNWGITGTIIGNALTFKATGTCQGWNALIEISQALITNNQSSGIFRIYRDGSPYCEVNFNLTRSTIPPVVYNINASAGTGGTINPAGNISVHSGDIQCFYLFPNEGYKIVDVIVDGVSVGAVSSYTFTNVTADHTIASTFKKKSSTTGILMLLLDD